MFSTASSVAILGAGHGGLALAGYLAQHGHRVTLWNRSHARIAAVAESGRLELTLPGQPPVVTRIAGATADLAQALAGARVVIVAVPACAHADVAGRCAAHLRDGQTVLLLPGRTGGALEFRRVLMDAGCRARVLVGEASTFPLAARRAGPAAGVIFGIKAEVQAAALPADRTPVLLAACRPLLPMLTPARSVLHTGLANVGAILHPVITLLNAERIERRESFDFYRDGVTSRVAAALAGVDLERRRIARAYGVEVCSLADWIASAYGHRADTLRATVADNPAYAGIKAPTMLHHRYLLEDVPTGLIPLVELGRVAGVNIPLLTRLVDQARAALGGEPWNRARTLDVLGLDGLDARDIRTFIEQGFIPQTKKIPRFHVLSLERISRRHVLIPQF